MQGVSKALGVFLAPAKTAAEKHLVLTLGQACASETILRKASQMGTVAKHAQGLDSAHPGECTEQGGTADGKPSRQQQRLRGKPSERGAGQC